MVTSVRGSREAAEDEEREDEREEEEEDRDEDIVASGIWHRGGRPMRINLLVLRSSAFVRQRGNAEDDETPPAAKAISDAMSAPMMMIGKRNRTGRKWYSDVL